MDTLCGLFGYSSQSYYKWDNQEFAADAMEPLIVEKVVVSLNDLTLPLREGIRHVQAWKLSELV